MTPVKFVLALAIAAAAFASGALEAFGYHWTMPDAADWKLDGEAGAQILHLVVGREPLPGARRPHQFAIADTPAFERVMVEADVQPTKRSLMIVFAYHDNSHFDYAHLSTDTGTKQPVHNGVFHVFGGERVRISSLNGPAAFEAINRWYHVVLKYDGDTGEVNVTVDGKPVLALHAYDLSLGAGKVGLGSFNETGDFKNVKISGK
jgi:hypothetical protein